MYREEHLCDGREMEGIDSSSINNNGPKVVGTKMDLLRKGTRRGGGAFLPCNNGKLMR